MSLPEPHASDCETFCEMAEALGPCRVVCQVLRWAAVDAAREGEREGEGVERTERSGPIV